MTSREDTLRAARQSLVEVGEIIDSLPPDGEAYRLATRALCVLRDYLRNKENAFAAKMANTIDNPLS